MLHDVEELVCFTCKDSLQLSFHCITKGMEVFLFDFNDKVIALDYRPKDDGGKVIEAITKVFFFMMI